MFEHCERRMDDTQGTTTDAGPWVYFSSGELKIVFQQLARVHSLIDNGSYVLLKHSYMY